MVGGQKYFNLRIHNNEEAAGLNTLRSQLSQTVKVAGSSRRNGIWKHCYLSVKESTAFYFQVII